MPTLITADLRDIASAADSDALQFVTGLRGGEGGAIITPRAVWAKPVNGALSIDLQPGPATVTIRGTALPFTVPDTGPADLWDLIAAAVGIPPQTPAQQLAAAVATYLVDHPVGDPDPAVIATAVGDYLTDHPLPVATWPDVKPESGVPATDLAAAAQTLLAAAGTALQPAALTGYATTTTVTTALDHIVWTGTQAAYDGLPNHTDYQPYGITS